MFHYLILYGCLHTTVNITSMETVQHTMTLVNSGRMGLETDQLNDLDEWILDFLSEHDWATPNLIRLRHGQEHEQKSRQWISDRVRRLDEHGHLEPVHSDADERRLVNDPRTEDDSEY